MFSRFLLGAFATFASFGFFSDQCSAAQLNDVKHIIAIGQFAKSTF